MRFLRSLWISLRGWSDKFRQPFARISKMKAEKDILGGEGERLAANFLKKKGMRILERNLRLPAGEIDLVARLKGKPLQIVVVEVKTRRDRQKGSPALAVHRKKQAKLTTLAIQYLQQNRLLGKAGLRFDIVAVSWSDETNRPAIEHFENAFEAGLHNLRY